MDELTNILSPGLTLTLLVALNDNLKNKYISVKTNKVYRTIYDNIIPIFLGVVFVLCAYFLYKHGIEIVLEHISTISGKDSTKDTLSSTITANGSKGDTFGGTLGPIVALIAAALTFFAFWVQFTANRQQRRDIRVERFESNYYAMINLHRENVSEINIANRKKGRKSFITMCNEFKFTYHATINVYEGKFSEFNIEIPEETLYNIAYFVFFFGIGPNSTKIIEDLIPSRYNGFITLLEDYLEKYQYQWEQPSNCHKIGVDVKDKPAVFELQIPYRPFNGHVTDLSHYIRHLFQTVKFLDKYSDWILSKKEKENYATTLRAQLSAYEQLFIYYNSLSYLGSPWLDKKENEESLIEKYALLRSIPLPLADFYKSPDKIFTNKINKAGRYIFEWYEIQERMKVTT